ncbi:MAG: cobalamin-binding protein [Pseudomonadota bacterium]|nr:cobalamin-binding protein [Pseudomonadota bacterium]
MPFARLRNCLLPVLTLALCLGSGPGRAAVCVSDDADRQVCLDQPASRIIALSPGATELLFAAGAGEQVVGAVSFSDYPPAAKQLPRVGSYKRLDLEAVLALAPDLVIAWSSGNPMEQVERLQALGVPVYISEPRRFEEISTTLERLAILAGTEAVGQGAADALRSGLESLRQRYAEAAPVTVFYQVWEEPLMTINNAHLISEAIRVCGGVNVFGELGALALKISREAVLAKDPEAIIAGGMGEEDPAWLDPWKQFPSLRAVKHDNLFFVAPSSLQRPTPKMLAGTRTLCTHLDTVRARD